MVQTPYTPQFSTRDAFSRSFLTTKSTLTIVAITQTIKASVITDVRSVRLATRKHSLLASTGGGAHILHAGVLRIAVLVAVALLVVPALRAAAPAAVQVTLVGIQNAVVAAPAPRLLLQRHVQRLRLNTAAVLTSTVVTPVPTRSASRRPPSRRLSVSRQNAVSPSVFATATVSTTRTSPRTSSDWPADGLFCVSACFWRVGSSVCRKVHCRSCTRETGSNSGCATAMRQRSGQAPPWCNAVCKNCSRSVVRSKDPDSASVR